MFKMNHFSSTTLIGCELQPGCTRTRRQRNRPITAETLVKIEELVEMAVAQGWNVILLEDLMRDFTFAAITDKLANNALKQKIISTFDDGERGIVLNDCAKAVRPLGAQRILLCGASASVHEVAATLYIRPDQQLEIIQSACSAKICRKEIMRQRRRSGRDLTTSFQIKPQL